MKRTFTIMRGTGVLAHGVPWEFVAPHERQALRNHGQSLLRLDERGGLGVKEMLAVVRGVPYMQFESMPNETAEVELLHELSNWVQLGSGQ